MNDSVHIYQTPCKNGLSVPCGYIVVHPRWKNTDLIKSLKLKVNVSCMDEIGTYDFLPTSSCCVVYITENDIVSYVNKYTNKIAKLSNSTEFMEKFVIVDNTPITKEQFTAIQSFVVLDCNMSIFPIESSLQAVEFLVQMVKNGTKSNNQNSFISKRHISACADSAILTTILKFPEVGNTKAKLLLKTFGSIEAIVQAKEQDLAKLIGKSAAQNLTKSVFCATTN